MKMSYEKLLLKLLNESSSQGSFNNLERFKQLSCKMGSPEKTFQIVHIAGSNGKGSTSLKIAEALQKGGYKTALYTSPHVFSFRERIQINGVCIPKEEVVDILSEIYEISYKEKIAPTFFEFTTLLAFEWFSKQEIDIAVIETGLGGARDATNIVEPILSVITSISLDHIDRLGDTEEKIAVEKSGIIKKGIPVVLGGKATQASILLRAREMQSPVLLTETLTGWYDIENQSIAKAALEFLRALFPAIPLALEPVLSKRPPCRFEITEGVLFDVAHNLDGFIRLFEGIDAFFSGMKIRMVLGFSKDKDIEGCLRLASKKATFIYLVEGDSVKAESRDVLGKILQKEEYSYFSLQGETIEVVKRAKEEARQLGELLVIAGSFYIMREAKRALCSHFDGDLFS